MVINNKNYLVRATNTSTNEVHELCFETETQARDWLNAHIVKPSVENSGSNVSEPISKRQLNQLTSTVSSLPTEKLLREAKTIHILLLRSVLNDDAQLLSKCLATRLSRQDGDPARNLLSGGNLDKLRHQITWATVEKYDALFSLIQLAWQPISEELSNFDECPKSGFVLFLRIICEEFDETFLEFLRKDFKLSPSSREDLYNARAKILYRNGVPLTEKQQNALKSNLGIEAYWLKLTLNICNQDVKRTQNMALAAKLRDYSNKEGLLSDYMGKFYTSERKAKGDTLIWEEQTLRM
jgi:hypothetical protein